jgi:hypothetical protein
MTGGTDQLHSGRLLPQRVGPKEKPRFFRVPETTIESIGSKLAVRKLDEYVNILKCMYSTRFNGGSTRVGSSLEDQPTPRPPVHHPLPWKFMSTLESGRPDNFRRRIKGRKEKSDY